jgi:hypothetical protein
MENYNINYKEIFQDAINTWKENDYKPIHLDNKFISIINEYNKNRKYGLRKSF